MARDTTSGSASSVAADNKRYTHGNRVVAKCNIVRGCFPFSFFPEHKMVKFEIYNRESDRNFRHAHTYMHTKLLRLATLLWQHINVFAVHWHDDTDRRNEKKTFHVPFQVLYVWHLFLYLQWNQESFAKLPISHFNRPLHIFRAHRNRQSFVRRI